MKKTRILFVIVLTFALLLGGAYILYERLGQTQAPEQLTMLQPQKQALPAEAANAAHTQLAAEEGELPAPADEAAATEEPTPETATQEVASSEHEVPKATETPVAPAAAEEPKSTELPETTEAADATEAPILSEEPAPSEEPEATEAPEEELMKAPGFTVYDEEGNPVYLSSYIGKPIVLNFWASWCGPCQREMPDFNSKYLEHAGEVTFLMVNMTDGTRETVQTASSFVAEQGYSFPVFYDTAYSAASTYGVYSLPTTYFIDAEGNLVAQATGAISASTLQQGIDMITE